MCCWPPGLTPESMFLKVPLLLGLIALGSPTCSSNFVDINKSMEYFAMCVEFAMFQFNQAYMDEYAYKLLWVRKSQRKVRGAFPSLKLLVVPETRPWRGKSLVCKKEEKTFLFWVNIFLNAGYHYKCSVLFL